MNNMNNLKSYDGVKSLQAYELSRKELLEYYNLKMETAQDNVEFMEKNIFGGGVLTTYVR